MSKEQTTEVANVDSKALAAIAQKYGTKGASKNIDQKDIELKRLKLAQGTSDIVQDGEVSVGQYYNSQDGTVLGSSKSPAEFVIFHMDKVWMEFDVAWNEEKKREEKEFKQVIPVTPETADLPYKDEANNIARDFTYNFYMLSVEEMKSGACIPYVFSMSRTQIKPAKNLNSKITEIAANGLPSFAYVFAFSSEGKQKGEGEDLKKWQQVSVSVGRVSTDKEMAEADRWFDILEQQAANIKVQGEEVKGKGAVDADAETVAKDDDDLPF